MLFRSVCFNFNFSLLQGRVFETLEQKEKELTSVRKIANTSFNMDRQGQKKRKRKFTFVKKKSKKKDRNASMSRRFITLLFESIIGRCTKISRWDGEGIRVFRILAAIMFYRFSLATSQPITSRDKI